MIELIELGKARWILSILLASSGLSECIRDVEFKHDHGTIVKPAEASREARQRRF